MVSSELLDIHISSSQSLDEFMFSFITGEFQKSSFHEVTHGLQT